ncbi:hypothetical protein UFOVP273_110 [uncultured Caudovirales phage]|uniref:Uncharacterized protein n=1 Tax=uncultured Caudovirales phage TaxID=2100421 RepID=A0A6J5LJW7_9CAUD|nr:hypothetical protein UFOVP273_110 [uncultured Caudovirales phage]
MLQNTLAKAFDGILTTFSKLKAATVFSATMLIAGTMSVLSLLKFAFTGQAWWAPLNDFNSVGDPTFTNVFRWLLLVIAHCVPLVFSSKIVADEVNK